MKLALIIFLISINSYAFIQVDPDGQVFRGKEPRSNVSELSQAGVSDVIIFKNDTKGEVIKEIADLTALGINPHHIPFRWKEFPSMIEACEQTVEALNLIHKIKQQNGKVFFHCTAGEDRTGMLAGLYRMLEENASVSKVFKQEMCARGYSDGSSRKPYTVTSAIQKELTPLFVTLSAKIESGEWRLGQLKKSSCRNIKIAPTQLKCKI